jgi:hypothetical protein
VRRIVNGIEEELALVLAQEVVLFADRHVGGLCYNGRTIGDGTLR